MQWSRRRHANSPAIWLQSCPTPSLPRSGALPILPHFRLNKCLFWPTSVTLCNVARTLCSMPLLRLGHGCTRHNRACHRLGVWSHSNSTASSQRARIRGVAGALYVNDLLSGIPCWRQRFSVPAPKSTAQRVVQPRLVPISTNRSAQFQPVLMGIVQPVRRSIALCCFECYR